MYACETWSTTRGDEQKLLIFERKTLRKIYGPILNPESGSCERRKNEDVESIFNKPNIQACLKAKRLESAGHVWRAKDKLIHKVLVNKPNGKRPRGRPRQRWLDRVNKDLESLSTSKIKDADDRELWRNVVKATKGL